MKLGAESQILHLREKCLKYLVSGRFEPMAILTQVEVIRTQFHPFRTELCTVGTHANS